MRKWTVGSLVRALAIAGGVVVALTLALANPVVENGTPQPSVAQAQTTDCIPPTPRPVFPYNYWLARITVTPVKCVQTSTPTRAATPTTTLSATPTLTSTPGSPRTAAPRIPRIAEDGPTLFWSAREIPTMHRCAAQTHLLRIRETHHGLQRR